MSGPHRSEIPNLLNKKHVGLPPFEKLINIVNGSVEFNMDRLDKLQTPYGPATFSFVGSDRKQYYWYPRRPMEWGICNFKDFMIYRHSYDDSTEPRNTVKDSQNTEGKKAIIKPYAVYGSRQSIEYYVFVETDAPPMLESVPKNIGPTPSFQKEAERKSPEKMKGLPAADRSEPSASNVNHSDKSRSEENLESIEKEKLTTDSMENTESLGQVSTDARVKTERRTFIPVDKTKRSRSLSKPRWSIEQPKDKQYVSQDLTRDLRSTCNVTSQSTSKTSKKPVKSAQESTSTEITKTDKCRRVPENKIKGNQ